MEVGFINSCVLLIVDVIYVIFVRFFWNDICFIVIGSGVLNELYLEYVFYSVDI